MMCKNVISRIREMMAERKAIESKGRSVGVN